MGKVLWVVPQPPQDGSGGGDKNPMRFPRGDHAMGELADDQIGTALRRG